MVNILDEILEENLEDLGGEETTSKEASGNKNKLAFIIIAFLFVDGNGFQFQLFFYLLQAEDALREILRKVHRQM